jgi:ABC transporter substrate binding protein
MTANPQFGLDPLQPLQPQPRQAIHMESFRGSQIRRREFITGLGSAAAWPVAARAQEPMPLVGFLYLGDSFGISFGNSLEILLAFRQGLAEAGFVEDKNVRFEFHGSASNQRLPALAVELVNKRPAVIVATGSPPAILAAKAATSTVPIVFATALDPLKYGFVTSLNRPLGNMTGISLLGSELVGKRLNLLLEVAPQAKKFAYLSGICESGQLPQDRRSDAKSSFWKFEVTSIWSRPSQPLSNKGPAQSRLEISLSLPTLAITSSGSLRATRFQRYTRLDSIPPPGG